jgi:hypothetical protein
MPKWREQMTVLVDLKAQENAELRAQIEALKAQLAANKPVKNGLKVSPKGAVSIYGYQRFPITIYAESLLDILSRSDEIKAWVETNRSELSWKERD